MTKHKTIRAKLDPDGVYPWEHHEGQHHDKLWDEPGIVEHEHELATEGIFQELLYYDEDGRLSGVLIHFCDATGLRKPGELIICVRPDCRKSGIGHRLIEEALKLWDDIDLYEQDCTPLGARLVRSVLTNARAA